MKGGKEGLELRALIAPFTKGGFYSVHSKESLEGFLA